MLLYADDYVIFANTAVELQNSLDLLVCHCKRWKLTINASKTKVIIFMKGGLLPRNFSFEYDGVQLEIVSIFF